MKNRIVILLGATVVFGMGLSSCSNNGGEGSYTQEQLDSITQYRIDSANLANKLANDSIINARADSLAKAESSKGAAPATQSKSTPTAVKKAPPTKVIQGANATVVKEAPKETRTQADIEADEKAARFGDKAAQERLKKDEDLQKAARFGDKNAQEELKKREAEEKADRFKK